MPLLDEEKLSALDRLSRVRADARDDTLRGLMFKGTPIGFKRLRTKQDRDLWTSHLKRQAMREREGFAPGDVANAALEHPAVQVAFNEDASAGL